MPRRKQNEDKNGAEMLNDYLTGDDFRGAVDLSKESPSKRKIIKKQKTITSNQDQRCGALKKTEMMMPGARPGVYDLAGDNVSGTYDLSHNRRINRQLTPPQRMHYQDWRTLLENQDWRTLLAIHRQKIILIGVVTACLIVGIGIHGIVMAGRNRVKENGTPPQSSNTTPNIGESSAGK